MSEGGQKSMLIIEFAESRNEKPDTIRKYISRHKDEFKGHTTLSGSKMEIDDVAYDLLEKVYPMPKPIQIVEDTEARKKLMQAQELIIRMQMQMMEMQEKVALADANKALLEDREHQISEMQAEKKELKEQLADKEKKIDDERTKNEALTSELSKYHKTFFGFYKKD